jgi:prephenate dehydrogenase
MKNRWKTVAIIGVGMIGGSIGRALTERKLAERLIGIGRRKQSLDAARKLGCVTETTTSIAQGVADAQLVVVCTPVELIPHHVAEAARHAPAGALLTDVGSTKALLVAESEQLLRERMAGPLPFVGSHPIAGSEKTGADAARGDLFVGRTVVVTPTAASDGAAVDQIEQFWQSLGAQTVRMSPGDHDAALARTSHLPHLVASALAAATPAELLALAAGGWCDTTRIAAGDPELWRQILAANSVHALKALADFETVICRLRKALEAGDGQLLAEILQEGKRRRDAVGS